MFNTLLAPSQTKDHNGESIVSLEMDRAEFAKLRLAVINAYAASTATLDKIGQLDGYQSDTYNAFLSTVDTYQAIRDEIEQVRYELDNKDES